MGLRGKSNQVFSYFSPDGPAHIVEQPSTYYLPRLRLLRNLLIQSILDDETDVSAFSNLLEELRNDPDLYPALPGEIVSAVSLSHLLIVLREQHLTPEDMSSWVTSVFGKLIGELESGRINYYDDSDWEISPPPGRKSRMISNEISPVIDEESESTKPSSRDISFSASTSWRIWAVACGVSVVAFILVLWWIPSNKWRAIVAGLTSIGAIVTIFVLSLNPANFYRRWLNYVIPGGMVVNALGFTFDVFYESDSSLGSLQWNSAVSGSFCFAWSIIVLGLVWGDLKSRN